ncbi:unnamed protein product [Spirodela intermedia]|nr:unnamed protein product [Spirodela intermedia]CAA6673723.1 unnamed protein product [Spirodela intermedia]
MSLLSDLPRSHYELWLSDLAADVSPACRGEAALGEGFLAEVATAAAAGSQAADAVEEIRARRSGKEWRVESCGEGILLNVYFPSSLTRSLTGSRLRRGPRSRAQAEGNR